MGQMILGMSLGVLDVQSLLGEQGSIFKPRSHYLRQVFSAPSPPQSNDKKAKKGQKEEPKKGFKGYAERQERSPLANERHLCHHSWQGPTAQQGQSTVLNRKTAHTEGCQINLKTHVAMYGEGVPLQLVWGTGVEFVVGRPLGIPKQSKLG